MHRSHFYLFKKTSWPHYKRDANTSKESIQPLSSTRILNIGTFSKHEQHTACLVRSCLDHQACLFLPDCTPSRRQSLRKLAILLPVSPSKGSFIYFLQWMSVTFSRRYVILSYVQHSWSHHGTICLTSGKCASLRTAQDKIYTTSVNHPRWTGMGLDGTSKMVNKAPLGTRSCTVLQAPFGTLLR